MVDGRGVYGSQREADSLLVEAIGRLDRSNDGGIKWGTYQVFSDSIEVTVVTRSDYLFGKPHAVSGPGRIQEDGSLRFQKLLFQKSALPLPSESTNWTTVHRPQ